MASLTNIQIGSIVLSMVENVSAGISGILPTIVNQQVYFAEQFTGDSIGTLIEDKYQPAIISLTVGNVLGLMEGQGMGTKSVKIGELSIDKGMVEGTSKYFINDGMLKLRILGEKISFYKANG
jgi:hypothetical protein